MTNNFNVDEYIDVLQANDDMHDGDEEEYQTVETNNRTETNKIDNTDSELNLTKTGPIERESQLENGNYEEVNLSCKTDKPTINVMEFNNPDYSVYFVNSKIGTWKGEALLDSGAALNFMSMELWNKVKNHSDILYEDFENPMNGLLADNTSGFVIRGQVICLVTVGQQTAVLEFGIVDKLTEHCVLGMLFFRDFVVDLNFVLN